MSGPNSIVLRTVYALDPKTGGYLNSNQMLLTDGLGGTKWVDSISTLIISGGSVLNSLPSSINYFSTAIYNTDLALSSMSTDMYTAISTLSTAISQTLPGAISQVNLLSTVRGLGSSGYVSTQTVNSIISSASAQGQVSGASVSSIVASLNSNYGIYDISTLTSYMQPSTISSLGTLGSLGYISTSQLISTVRGLGASGYVSSSYITSTIQGLGTSGYISSTNTISTVRGLGSSGYISSLDLISSVTGLGSAGYISSFSPMFSSIRGLGSVNYVSTDSLVSTVDNLKTFYTANAGVTGDLLISTVEGLGSSSYVSTMDLISTTRSLADLRVSAQFDDVVNATVVGGINYFTNVNNVVYISSFLMSSITFSGNQGYSMKAVVDDDINMTFSTASIDLSGFSNYITNKSRVTIDIYPNIAFSKLATGANSVAVLPISTFLKYGSSNMYNTTVTSFVNAFNTSNYFGTSFSGLVVHDLSNFFTTPIKLCVPMGEIKEFTKPYEVFHYMPGGKNNGVNQNALHSNDLTPFFASTGSLYVSVQNLPT